MFKIPFLSRSSSKSTTQVSNTAEQNDISVQDINSLADLFGVMPSFAGPAVTPKTSMKVSIVFACVRLIAGAIAQMPVHIFEQSEKNDKQRVPNHSLANLFNLQPTPAWRPPHFRSL